MKKFEMYMIGGDMLTLDEIVKILEEAKRVEADIEVNGKRCKVVGYRVKDIIRLDISYIGGSEK